MRGILPRLNVLKSLAPRVTAPLLPVSNIRLARSALTNTPRVSSARHFTRFHAKLASQPSSPPPPGQKSDERADQSLTQRLKHLIKSYGWYALGVYLVLSALDFGVAFVGVNLLGAEYVSHVAASVKSTVVQFFPSRPADPGRDEIESMSNPNAQGGQEGLYAMLVLAYTIHKTLFLPVRIGLTGAFTPRLVAFLSRRGWTGTEGTRRAAHEMRERIRERRNRDSN
ncbi:hypothetical protein D9613_000602 [Agrocybe pediades]|uniref:DUF1279 domain-containing protein n=1 Tax=Agrocybe pediades TaxID=84607 RepID=A0A8H4VUJ8_9AGAR|nr:hypothetical protein D9613_000602 [Agrocybe pediades]KAF9562783.1 hypothetical protein CPC08DRAFT_362669 [Agrocybe pediades]